MGLDSDSHQSTLTTLVKLTGYPRALFRLSTAFRVSVAALFTLVMITAATGRAQSLSTTVFPSEDELLEALKSGEIDITQYRDLIEIISSGVDSSTLFLLDQIPNLSYFRSDSAQRLSLLEGDQRTSFRSPRFPPNRLARLRYRYTQRFDPDEPSTFHTSVHMRLNSVLQSSLAVRRDYTGREQCVERALRYHSNTGTLRALTLGSYRARLGLGTVFGNHSKLLQPASKLSGESFLFPAHSGYNGLLLETAHGAFETQTLVSLSRDSTVSLRSLGFAVRTRFRSITPTLVAGFIRLERRGESHYLDDTKIALSNAYRYRRGNVTVELCTQIAERSRLTAFVAEGEHRLSEGELQYAAWSYSDRFLDLTAGSKAASLARSRTIDELGFDFSDSRSGQRGALTRLLVPLSSTLKFASALVVSARHRDTSNTQVLTALEYSAASRWSSRIDYLGSLKRRDVPGEDRERADHRVRFEARLRTDKLSARTYIGVTFGNRGKGTAMLFASLRYDSGATGIFELWSNLARVTFDSALYWYSFVRAEQQLWADGVASVKVSHRYSRSEKERHRLTVGLELNTTL